MTAERPTPRVAGIIATDRLCETCDAPLVRRPVESAAAFRRRRFCSMACASRQRTAGEWIGVGVPSGRHCAVCQAELRRRADENPCDFHHRTTCGRECQRIARRATQREVAKRRVLTCRGCNASFPRLDLVQAWTGGHAGLYCAPCRENLKRAVPRHRQVAAVTATKPSCRPGRAHEWECETLSALEGTRMTCRVCGQTWVAPPPKFNAVYGRQYQEVS